MDKTRFMKRVFKLSPYVMTSDYGWRIHPITRIRSFHYGEDYSTYRKKVPCYSPVYGVVKESTYNVIRGHYVTITTKQGLVRMQHLDSRAVKVGQRVIPGTKVGVVGTTGSSTGIHLHIEYKTLSNYKLDPAVYIPSYKDPIIARKKVAVAVLNVRSGPGTEFTDVGNLTKDTPVEIFAYKSDSKGRKWGMINYLGGEWVADWLLV